MPKRVLFLAYHFPPHRHIAAVRTGAIAQALADAGWQVTVLTIADELLVNVEARSIAADGAPPRRIRILGTGHSLRNLVPGIVRAAPNRGVRRLLWGTARRGVSLLALDREIGWRKHALAGAAAFTRADVDVVLSSGGPWISHQMAARLAKRIGCPYVLDYRDLWSGSPRTALPWKRITELERKLYCGAGAVVAIAPSMQRVQEGLFGRHPDANIVSNGFDARDCEQVEPAAFKDFALVYAGHFAPPIGAVDPLFELARRLRESRAAIPWSFHYYGRDTVYVQQAAARHGMRDQVIIHGYRPRCEALSAVKGAGLALAVASVAREAPAAEAGILTGKVFEAIGLGAPFLVVAPRNSDIRAVVETTGGGAVFAADETPAMAHYVEQVMKGRGIPYRSPHEYSWTHLGSTLTDILGRAAAVDVSRP